MDGRLFFFPYYRGRCREGGIRMPYISINSRVRLYYEEKGNGTPLLFIHPPGMGHVVFCRQKPLARDFRLILYDMRGNGRSSPSDGPITVPLLADDVSVLLRSLGIGRAIICGYSSGGSVALDFALRYPQHVKQLILIGGFPEVCTPLLWGEFWLGISAIIFMLVVIPSPIPFSFNVKNGSSIFCRRSLEMPMPVSAISK